MGPKSIFFQLKNTDLQRYTENHLREYSINTAGKEKYLFNRSLGNIGEAVARLVLENKEYKIIAENFRCPSGEIDIIASSSGKLIFVEVKTRTSDDFGSPAESIDARKALKIRKTASLYLLQKYSKNPPDCRFDIISIVIKRNTLNAFIKRNGKMGSAGSIKPEIISSIIDSCIVEHIESAF